jgi:DNA-binding transcriptional regulator YiaG
LALLGIGQRSLHRQRTPDSGRRQARRRFLQKVSTLGDVLQHARRIRGLTQRELAALLEVSRTTIQSWESEIDSPTPAAWRRLAEIIPLPPTAAEAMHNS